VLIPPVGYLQKLREITDEARHPADLRRGDHRLRPARLAVRHPALRRGPRPRHRRQGHHQRHGADGRGDRPPRHLRRVYAGPPEKAIELFHGYTYSAHPLACAAAIATLDVYRDEDLFARAARLAPQWEQAVHSLRDCPNVIDVRNIGLIGAIELAPRAGAPGTRAFDAFTRAFHEQDMMIRVTGDIIALSPPLIIESSQIDELVGKLGDALREVGRKT
jgi:beta-alanine--pyruvate transaminase